MRVLRLRFLISTLALAFAAGAVQGAPLRSAVGRLAYHPQVPALHPNLARGLDLGNRFDADGFTTINLWNGNLLAALSLGQPYPVDSRLSYQLVLHYNSHVWDFEGPVASELGRPVRLANSGLGFDLSLGRLFAPGSGWNATGLWMYVAPDGSPHLFYSDLHHDTPDPADPGDAVRYTRDGTYLRLRTAAAGEMRVELPDGTFRAFTPEGSEWRLSRIGSPGGSAVDVAYAKDGSVWTITDTHGRIQTVTFTADPTGQYPRLVDRVELSAFGGARAVWDFTYTATAVPRDCADARGGTETVPLLSSITGPLGQAQTLEYDVSGCTGGGRLKRLQLEPGGFLEWAYGAQTFPPFDCTGSTPAYFRSVSGVASRRKVAPDGTVAGTWTYAAEVDAAASPSCDVTARRRVVTTPLGDRTVHHFASATLASPALYALPFAPGQPDASGGLFLSEEVYDCTAGSNCVLMRTKWARWAQDQSCSSITGNCFDTNRRLVREKTVYEDDDPVAGVKRFAETSRTGFDGLGNFRTTVRTSNFGKADFQRITRFTNPEAGSYPAGLGGGFSTPSVFSVPSPSLPWVLHDYSYTEIEDDAGARVRADSCFSPDGWLLRLRRRAEAAAPSSRDVVTVNTWAAGEITETALVGGDTQAVGVDADLCALPLPSVRFAMRREHRYGALARETDLDASGALLPFHRVDRDIDRDTGHPAVERDVAGLATVFERDLLGRTVWAKPVEGAWTQTVYAAPNGGSAWNSGPTITVYRRPNGGGSPLTTTSLRHDVYGRRTGEWTSQPGGVTTGRRVQWNAQGLRTSESTAYQVGSPGTLYWTQYLNHDPFGRPRTIRPPEGAAHDEVLAYRGDREVRRTYKAGKAYAGATGTCYEDTVTATFLYDGQGREWLRRIEQPQPLPGRTDETEKAFTPLGKTRLEIVRKTVGATTQVSSTETVFDGRGFVLSTTLREGDNPVSETGHEEYDARGLARRETTSGDAYPAPGISILKTYDDAGRLAAIADGANPGKLWKELVYGTDNAPSDRRLGRLVQAVRHNYFESAHHTVTESYVYGGLGGKVSEKTLAIATVSSASQELRMDKAYRLTASYNDLGDPVAIGYPACVTCSPGEPQSLFTLNPVWSQGALVSLGGTRGAASESWLSSVTWSLSGQPFQVTHGNGLTDVWHPDPYRRPRPSSVQVLSATATRYDSGLLVYDGAGQRCGIGSRSVLATPALPPGEEVDLSAPCAMPYRLDPFGQWNGELLDPQCGSLALPTMKLFDAADRPVAQLNRAALKPLNAEAQTFWVPDPANFYRVWRLYGLDGRLLTEVEDRLTPAWRTRRDHIHGLGDLQGKALQTWAAPGFVQLVHKHPMGVKNTGANGSPLANEL